MRLSWNEIRARASRFSGEWAEAKYEKGETQSFYNAFFEVFGVQRRKVASFEEPVKKLGDKQGFIDLLWKGVLLVEHKSAGRDLAKAKTQAFDYFPGLKDAEHPRYILTCDFQNFELFDLEENTETRFPLSELCEHIEAFGFILGVQRRTFKDQDPVNVEASALMGKLHDALKASDYEGDDLERFLVRLVFCLFADDTGIFPERNLFLDLINQRTNIDGSDTGQWLIQLFEVLNTFEPKRQKALDEDLDRFPYINGDLFKERLPIPAFDAAMRALLIEACEFSWDAISPAIFGSLFQSVMNAKERRASGAHYTTEKNILKVIQPLFLDDLRSEFAAAKARKGAQQANALKALQDKLAGLTFFDPACGCGNFLIIAYRELRSLELEILRFLHPTGQRVLDVSALSQIDVNQFYGIEIGEFPARIAEVALWMMDHIMNNRLSLEFGEAFARIPLKASPHIHHADALEKDWTQVLRPENCSFILGNPPFIGAKMQTENQRQQVRGIAKLGKTGGTLDYVCAWFLKAGAYVNVAAPSRSAVMAGLDPAIHVQTKTVDTRGDYPVRPARERTSMRIGFVATNSITQGEQVAQLWPLLFDRYALEIAFAHRTFAWGSDARGMAHVHVVILGLTKRDDEPETKRLFSYEKVNSEPTESQHKALSPYLFDAGSVANRHIVVKETAETLNNAPRLKTGVQMIDDGIYTFKHSEMVEFLEKEPDAKPFFKKYIGGDEYIKGFHRWILYLRGIRPDELRKMPQVQERVKKVREFRGSSKRSSTIKMADTPTYLGVDERLKATFLVVPNTSSERRDYVPIGWLPPDVIANRSYAY